VGIGHIHWHRVVGAGCGAGGLSGYPDAVQRNDVTQTSIPSLIILFVYVATLVDNVERFWVRNLIFDMEAYMTSKTP